MPGLSVHPEVPAVSEQDVLIALGGAPAPARSGSVEGEKAAGKRRKRELKLREEAHRPPRSFERFRILMEVVSEGRQMVELLDHKARYALVILGVLNAGIFFLLARADLTHRVPGITPWLLAGFGVYAALSCVFVYHAIEALRPRRMDYAGETIDPRGPLGVMYWETVALQDIDRYRQEWSEIRMGQINAELVLLAHRLSRLIRAKHTSLCRLYRGLLLLVGFALLVLVAGTGLLILWG